MWTYLLRALRKPNGVRWGREYFSLDTEQVLMLPLKLVDLSGEKNSVFEKCLTCKC